MAVTYGFYNALYHDRLYDAIQMSSLFDGIIQDGIFSTIGTAMIVTAPEDGLYVNVGPGRAWFNHTWTNNDTEYPIEAEEAEVVLDRIDAVILEVNSGATVRANSIKFLKGTPSSEPVKPTLMHNAEINQYALAYVRIRAGQTTIFQSDVENVVGTEETPFVTGLLQQVSIDQLILQWEAAFQQHFANWVATNEREYEEWSEEQEIAFEGWREAQEADFEAWFQNLEDQLDSNQAAHLQLQIGNLNDLTTDDKRDLVKAINEINSKLVVSELLLDYDADLVGTVVTLSHTASIEGHNPETHTVTLPEPAPGAEYEVEVDVRNLGEWVLTWTYQGTSYEEVVELDHWGNYHIVLHGGFSWRQWATMVGISILDHETLAELLADEAAVRQLCIVHDAVDYFCGFATVSGDQETVINNDIFAKWVSLSDYSMDKMEANAAIKAVMDTADKYGYGELALMPQVPTMTSNTAPYGEVTKSSEYSSNYMAWKAFDKNVSTYWSNAYQNGDTWQNTYIGYKFERRIKLGMVVFKPFKDTAGLCLAGYAIKGSNDNGATWDTLAAGSVSTDDEVRLVISSEDTYDEIRLVPTSQSPYSASSNAIAIRELQFYALGPKGNIPVMTSNTAPYGKASASQNDSTAFQAFVDDGLSVWWQTQTNSAQSLQIDFANPINIKKLRCKYKQGSGALSTLTFKYSMNGSTWTAFGDVYSSETTTNLFDKSTVLDNPVWALHVKVEVSFGMSIYFLQFYGRELKVSVPAMTSNSTPYGEVTSYAAYGGRPAWHAFDNDSSTEYASAGGMAATWIAYDFKKNIIPVMMTVLERGTADKITKFSVSAHDISSSEYMLLKTIDKDQYQQLTIVDLENTDNVAYSAFKIQVLAIPDSNPNQGWRLIQIYGKDYSEKEFEPNTNKKWLYDHSVELETINYSVGTSGRAENLGETLYAESNGTQNANRSACYVNLDLTSYSLARVRGVRQAVQYATLGVFETPTVTTVAGAAANGSKSLPDTLGLDISGVNGQKYLSIHSDGNGAKFEVAEWWLE